MTLAYIILIVFVCWYAAARFQQLTKEVEKTREAVHYYAQTLGEYDRRTAVIDDYLWDPDEVNAINNDLEYYAGVLGTTPTRVN